MNGWQWVRIGAVLGFLAVAMGAFGAHGLKASLSQAVEAGSGSDPSLEAHVARRIENYQTGVAYHMSHALAIVAVGIASILEPGRARGLSKAGWCFLAGTVLFSGGLYVYTLFDIRQVGMTVPPLGGVAFLAGWGLLAVTSGSRVQVKRS
jgi:uncharacterized membrane protein YgdD (TMEM256/DUF423 family)